MVSMPETHAKAAEALQQKLAEAGLQGVEVQIGQGFTDHLGETGGQRGSLQFNFKGDVIATDAQARDKILTALKNTPPLVAEVELDPPSVHLEKLRKQLEDFIAKGANIPKAYLKWKGFDPELAKEWRGVRDHAINITSFDKYGVKGSITVPESQKEAEKEKATNKPEEKLANDLNEMKTAFTDKLVARQAKSEGVALTDTEGMARIRAKVDKVHIEFSAIPGYHGEGYHESGRVYFSIMSAEQKAEQERLRELQKAGKSDDEMKLDAEALKKLAQTNFLSEHSKEKAAKLIGHSIFHNNHEKADEVFAQIAGHEDMKRAISRQLKILKYGEAGQKDSELAKSVDTFLADDAFKKHERWSQGDDQKDPLKPHPVLEKFADPEKAGLITFTFSLPKDKMTPLLDGIAASAPPATVTEMAAAAQPQPAAPPEQLNTVPAGPETARIEPGFNAGNWSKTVADQLVKAKEQQTALGA